MDKCDNCSKELSGDDELIIIADKTLCNSCIEEMDED